MKLLLYCTKLKPYLYREDDDGFKLDNKINYEDISDYKKYYGLNNGKIVAECDFEVEEILHADNCISYYCRKTTLLQEKSCLTDGQIYSYLKDKNGYAIHIKNLHIFDEPRKLYDCLIHPKIEPKYYGCEHLSKAPQNMMYVELDDKSYVLISIKPEWLFKILNCEKTVEVRKKVLKGML